MTLTGPMGGAMSLGMWTVRGRIALDGALIGAVYLLAIAYRLADLEMSVLSGLWLSTAPVLLFVVPTHLALALAGEHGLAQSVGAGSTQVGTPSPTLGQWCSLVRAIAVRIEFEVFVAPLSALLSGGLLTCVVLGLARLWTHRVVGAPTP